MISPFALAVYALAGAALSPFDPSLRILGRFDSTSAGAEISWPGTGMQIAFEGRNCQVRMSSTGAILGVRIDAMPAKEIDLLAPVADTIVSFAANLGPGRHVVEFVKKTESSVGSLVLKEVLLDGKPSTPPRLGRRRLEYIGNSITCGYGVLDSVKERGFSPRTQDFTATYAWHATDNLGGELQAVCYSGKGLARNYDGSTGQILPQLYTRATASPDSKAWNFSKWKPDAVVIDLGQNDFAKAPLPDSALWEGAWIAFLETIRKVRGDIPIVLANGPMLSDYWPLDASGKALPAMSKVRRHLRNVAAAAKAKGFASVTVLDFTPNSPQRGYGADWHPNREQQRLNGQELSEHLKKTLGW